MQRPGCAHGSKLLTWVRITQLKTRITDLQTSQLNVLHCPTCELESWTLFFINIKRCRHPVCFFLHLKTLQYLEGNKESWWKDSCSKLRGSQNPPSCEKKSWILASEQRNSFWLLLHPETSMVSHGERKHCKHEFTQNFRFSVAMRTDLTA